MARTNRRDRSDGRMSIRDFAAHIGVTHPAVIKAIQDGRLLHSVSYDAKQRPRIDPDRGAEEWEARTDHDRRRSQGSGGRPKQDSLFEEGQAGEPRSDGARSVGFQGKSLADWRAMNLALQARQEQLDLQVREGKLVDLDTTRAEWFTRVRAVRERLLLIADRLSGPCSAETNQHVVRQMIDNEIRLALTQLSDGQ